MGLSLHTHPIHERDFLIETAACASLIKAIQIWIFKDLLGGYIYGYPRVGKSHLIAWCAGRFKTRGGHPIPVVVFDEPALSGVTDRQLWLAAVTSCDLHYTSRANTRELFLTLVGYLLERALETRERRIVIFIDEAQDLSKPQLLLYRSLANRLIKKNVNPLFVLVGSDEMEAFVVRYQTVANSHIHGRFFNAGHQVMGLKSVEEVRTALAHYDEKLRWDRGSTCWTEDFLPKSYAAGFRLKAHAERFWIQLGEAYPYRSKTGWPMQSFVITIRNLLCDNLLRDNNQLADDAIKEAIRGSALLVAKAA